MDRREFLSTLSIASTVLLVPLNAQGLAVSAMVPSASSDWDARIALDGGYVGVTSSGEFFVFVSKHEMGQGTSTAFGQMVAHEWDLPAARVAVVFPDSAAGFAFGTGGSTTMIDMWKPLRASAANLRRRLIRAAATQLQLPETEFQMRGGMILDRRGRSLPLDALLPVAATLTVADEPLRPIGKDSVIGQRSRRVHLPEITQGRYRYASDHAVEGQKHAVLVRAPSRSAVRLSDNREVVEKLPGVVGVYNLSGQFERNPAWLPFPVRDAVAIVADSTWAALQAKKALQVEWDGSADAEETAASLHALAQLRAGRDGARLWTVGTASPTTPHDTVVEADYVYPFQFHQAMEPLSAIAHHQKDRVEIWAAVQSVNMVVRAVERRFGILRDKVTVHTFPSGGSFGRRYFPDYVLEAVAVSEMAGNVPIKLQWTREDDLRFDLVHSWSHARYRAVLRDGQLREWHQKLQRTYFGDGETPWFGYNVPCITADNESLQASSPLDCGSWRAVVANNNAFGQECFLDEIAQALDRDPIALRRELLEGDDTVGIGHSYRLSRPRLRGVLDALESMLLKRRIAGHLGVALYPYMHGNCYAAAAAIVASGKQILRVAEILIAADVGLVVNASQVAAQLEGGAIWALTAVLHGDVRIKGGAVTNTGFADSPIVRIDACPVITVLTIPSPLNEPCGVGELSPPVVGAAICNAVSRWKKTRVRSLPIGVEA